MILFDEEYRALLGMGHMCYANALEAQAQKILIYHIIEWRWCELQDYKLKWKYNHRSSNCNLNSLIAN